MMGGNNTNQTPDAKPFGIQDQMTATNQQGLPVVHVAGTRKIAATWLTPLYNLRAQEAPNTIPSKK